MINIDILIPTLFRDEVYKPLLITILKNSRQWLKELYKATNLIELCSLENKISDLECYIIIDKPVEEYYGIDIYKDRNSELKRMTIPFSYIGYSALYGSEFRDSCNIMFRDGINFPKYSISILDYDKNQYSYTV
jgi:hypothetical protein|nr:MAG TPA: hypothetical protein [Crassvirales sp.]